MVIIVVNCLLLAGIIELDELIDQCEKAYKAKESQVGGILDSHTFWEGRVEDKARKDGVMAKFSMVESVPGLLSGGTWLQEIVTDE